MNNADHKQEPPDGVDVQRIVLPDGFTAWPDETGHDACPTLRCEMCNGVGSLKGPGWPGDWATGLCICPRCKGGGIDPDCTKDEIGKGVRISKQNGKDHAHE